MLILNPNTNNTIVITLTDMVIENPYFLFRFVHKESKNEYLCLSPIIETYTNNRYSFNITTTSGAPNALSGQIKLIYGDEYEYFVYEKSTEDTNYTTGTLLKEGLMKYNKAIATRNEYERNTTTRKVYTR